MAIKKCQPRVLTPYLDGELAPDTREQVEEHLRSCAACGALLEEATSARERVRGMGRSMIPETTLMPALELFRERAGLAEASQLDLEGITEPMDGPEIYDDPRFHAVLARAPLDGVGLMAPPPAAENEIADLADEPVAAPAATVTWVAMDAPVDAAADDTPVSQMPQVPESPPFVPAPWVTSAPPAPPEPEVEEDAGPLPWEQPAPEETPTTALEDRPDAPEPQPVPPWVEAEAADAEDMEARGRRLVEEDLAAQLAMEREAGGLWHGVPSAGEHEPHIPSILATELAAPEPPLLSPPEPVDEVAAAVARMREELTGPPAPATSEHAIAATEAEVDTGTRMRGYRDALRTQRREAGTTTMPALDKQLRIGLVAAAVIVLIAVGGVVVLPRLGSHRTGIVAAKPAGSPAGRATAAATTSPRTAASAPAPSTVPGVPQLSGPVNAGAGGSGYRVLRIRTGNPAAGVSRIVFDLEGSGAAPDAQLGRASDGSLYLQATGINIDPAIVAAFRPIGPISALSATGARSGLSLKLASALAVSPQYSIYYLTGPNRLVIDLK